MPAHPPARVLFVSGHFAASRRKAGFHFLAEAMAAAGADVAFLTVGISPISRLRGDPRFADPVMAHAGAPVRLPNGVLSLVWHTPYHPFSLRFRALDRATAPLARAWARLPLGHAEDIARRADLIVVESGPALLLTRRLRELAPSARLAYRVSDDTRNIGQHAAVVAEEEAVAPLFDLISAPSRFTAERFGRLPATRFQPHGIDLAAFDRPCADPFGERWETEVVSVGHSFFDPSFPAIAADAMPHWRFHYVGRLKPEPRRPNIVWHGEMPFADTIPFVRHADIGAAPYARREGGETLRESSLKLIQYTRCRLPAVAPEFVTRPDRPHVVGYEPGDAVSIRAALARARAVDRAAIRPEPVQGWAEVARDLADAAGVPLPRREAAE
jgi:2-beta-glucuronyltransferase